MNKAGGVIPLDYVEQIAGLSEAEGFYAVKHNMNCIVESIIHTNLHKIWYRNQK